MKPTVQIDVFSDVVCPWCYIGKRRLEKALEALENEFSFQIRYLPFELNPSMPESGTDQRAYLTQKFGGSARYEQITAQVTRVAAEEGLDFRFDKQQVSPNTRKAHQLIRRAMDFGVQPQVKEAFMQAYFTQGIALNAPESLVAVAVGAGVPKQAAEEALSESKLTAEVVQLEKESQRLGITGVPFYIINQKYGLSGAQPTEVFMSAIRDSVKTPA